MSITPIDRLATQANLKRMGFALGGSGPNKDGVDGDFGRASYTALFTAMSSPKVDRTVLTSIGIQAAITFPKFGLDASVERLCDILAQTSNETGGYTTFEENMHYSAKRIHEIWPNRFPTVASALPYAWDSSDPDREDIALANKVYGDRMGNETNGTADNDGWESRGMGMLQSTGLANLHSAETRLHLGLDANPELAAVPNISLIMACDFYQVNGVLKAIDDGDLLGARKITNRGNRYSKIMPVGWDEVQRRRALAQSIVVKGH